MSTTSHPPGPRRAAWWLAVAGLCVIVVSLWYLVATPSPTEFGTVSATVAQPGGTRHQLCLLHAATPEQVRRGLMGVTDPDLGGCDGMVFSFPVDQTGAFWMRDTPLPLSLAYFDSAGRLVSTVDMAPCGDRPDCPYYPPAAPYRYAIEVPRGRLAAAGIVPGARLTLGAPDCR